MTSQDKILWRTFMTNHQLVFIALFLWGVGGVGGVRHRFRWFESDNWVDTSTSGWNPLVKMVTFWLMRKPKTCDLEQQKEGPFFQKKQHVYNIYTIYTWQILRSWQLFLERVVKVTNQIWDKVTTWITGGAANLTIIPYNSYRGPGHFRFPDPFRHHLGWPKPGGFLRSAYKLPKLPKWWSKTASPQKTSTHIIHEWYIYQLLA